MKWISILKLEEKKLKKEVKQMKKLKKRKAKAGNKAINPFHIDLGIVANQEMKTHAHHKGKLSEE